MNRSKDDYLKRLQSLGITNKEVDYLNLNGKNGQNLINPAYKNVYNENIGNSEIVLGKSGAVRNRLKVRILAEEIYEKIKERVHTRTIKIEKDIAGRVRKVFIENCDVMISLFYEDLHYRLNKVYGVFDLPEEEQHEKIIDALKNVNTWGVLRNQDGSVVKMKDLEVDDIKTYFDKLNDIDPIWYESVVEKWKTRVKAKYESNCEKIQIKVNNYQNDKNIDFADVFKNSGDSKYNDQLDLFFKNTEDSKFIPPDKCTAEMKEMCKIKTQGECRPCDKEKDFIEGTDSSSAKVACPRLCDNLSGDPNSVKYCQYCDLCTGDPVDGKKPPVGKSWVNVNELKPGEGSPTITSYPTKFEDDGLNKGIGNVEWWKYLFPPNADPSKNVNIRSCDIDTEMVMVNGTLVRRRPAGNKSSLSHGRIGVTQLAPTSGPTSKRPIGTGGCRTLYGKISKDTVPGSTSCDFIDGSCWLDGSSRDCKDKGGVLCSVNGGTCDFTNLDITTSAASTK